MQDMPVQEKLAGFKALRPLIQRDEEKRLLLGALAEVPRPEALTLAASYLSDAAISNEACFAVIAIAEKMAPANKPQVTRVLQDVLKMTTHDDVKKRARLVLGQVRE